MGRLGQLAGLLVLTAAIYAPMREAPFVYEDANYQAAVRALSWQLPGRSLTLWTWQQAPTPEAGHLLNVALHLVNGVLVYGIGSALVGGAGIVAAGVFLLHPLASSAVAYVSGRSDLLVTLGVLVALLALVRLKGGWRMVGVSLGLLVAAESKEIGLVGVPLVLLTMAIRGRDRWLGVGLFLALGTVCGLTWSRLVGWASLVPSAGGSADTWPTYLLMQNAALWHLLSLTVWPVGQSLDHDIAHLGPTWHVVSVLATVQVLALIGLLWHRAPVLAWGLAFVLVSVVPRFAFRSHELITEPQMYLPFVGVCLGMAALVSLPWRIAARKDCYA